MDAEVAHGLAEFFLGLGVSAHHSVIFPGGESLVGAEFELVEEVFASVVFEHAEVGGVFELEFGGLGHGRVGESDPGGESCGEGGGCFEDVTSGWVHLGVSLAGIGVVGQGVVDFLLVDAVKGGGPQHWLG